MRHSQLIFLIGNLWILAGTFHEAIAAGVFILIGIAILFEGTKQNREGN